MSDKGYEESVMDHFKQVAGDGHLDWSESEPDGEPILATMRRVAGKEPPKVWVKPKRRGEGTVS